MSFFHLTHSFDQGRNKCHVPLPEHAFLHIQALAAAWQLLWKESYYELNHHIFVVDQQTLFAVVANNLEGTTSWCLLRLGSTFQVKLLWCCDVII